MQTAENRAAESEVDKMTYTKTSKTAALREPGNHWINRRVYEDHSGREYVKINGMYFATSELMLDGWEIDIVS